MFESGLRVGSTVKEEQIYLISLYAKKGAIQVEILQKNYYTQGRDSVSVMQVFRRFQHKSCKASVRILS